MMITAVSTPPRCVEAVTADLNADEKPFCSGWGGTPLCVKQGYRKQEMCLLSTTTSKGANKEGFFLNPDVYLIPLNRNERSALVLSDLHINFTCFYMFVCDRIIWQNLAGVLLWLQEESSSPCVKAAAL